LSQADLAQFTGTEHWYRHGLIRSVLYTDGVKHVADAGGAYWLIDEIAFAQRHNIIAAQPLPVWRLIVKDIAGVLTCEDGNGHSGSSKRIAYTDFPLPEISFYFTDKTILLPSEY